MAFKSVQVARYKWRVLDEERGIELKRVSGSSDGVLSFRLISDVDNIKFSAKLFPEFIQSGVGDKSSTEVLLWRLSPSGGEFQYGKDEDEVAPLLDLLTEAFELYQAAGRQVKGRVVRVEFGRYLGKQTACGGDGA